MGHIPKSESTEIEILTFSEAINTVSENNKYDQSKWIYIPNFYSEYRYILGTVGNNPLITIGINPSTAAPDALDRTLESVNRIAKVNGFDSFIMFNVYAQRATDSSKMDKIFNHKLHQENMKAFKWTLERCKNTPTIWAAWGTLVEKNLYLKQCMRDMVSIANEYNAKWYKAGKVSKNGHPHHPLYLKSNSILEDFDMEQYLQS